MQNFKTDTVLLNTEESVTEVPCSTGCQILEYRCCKMQIFIFETGSGYKGCVRSVIR